MAIQRPSNAPTISPESGGGIITSSALPSPSAASTPTSSASNPNASPPTLMDSEISSTVLPLSTVYVDVPMPGITTFGSKAVGFLTFAGGTAPEDWGNGNLTKAFQNVNGSWTSTVSFIGMNWTEATGSVQAYALTSEAVKAAGAEQKSTPPPAQSGHASKAMAGAAVGSFLGGVILATALVTGFSILRTRKKHRQRRDMQIQKSFDRHPSPAARQRLEDIQPSSNDPREALTSHQPETEHTSDKPTVIDAPKHIVTQVRPHSRSIAVSSVRSAPDTVGKRRSIDGKRQSFPTMLNGRPQRTISISAAGLISPMAAACMSRNEQGIEDIVKQLRMQISTLFEQIEMHVDNFYHAQRHNQGEPLSESEQGKLHLVESPHLEDSVAALLPAAPDARSLIKHCVAELVTSRLDYRSRVVDPDDSLLPSSLLVTYKLMAASSKGDTPGQDLGDWRVQTVTLLGIENIEKSTAGQIRRLADLVTCAFNPWAVARYGTEARSSHLESIFRHAVELGLEVFGTHEPTRWLWTSLDGNGRMVLFPGFLIELPGGRCHSNGDCSEVAKPRIC